MATGEVSSTKEIPESKGIFVSGENPLRLSVYSLGSWVQHIHKLLELYAIDHIT